MTKRDTRYSEPFAAIPVSVLETPAAVSLPHAAVRVLLLLAAQYTGKNNGRLACTRSYARSRGVTSNETVERALAALVAHGLVRVTRQGWRTKHLPTLYALEWRDVNWSDGKERYPPTTATHNYARWRPS
jgi:hypothetical protein